MPKPKPDQVVVHRIELQDHERKLLERYVTAHNIDKGSEAVSQWVGTFFGTPEGLLASYLVLDLIDRFAIPEDGFGEVLLTMAQIYGKAFTGDIADVVSPNGGGSTYPLQRYLDDLDKQYGFPESGSIDWERKEAARRSIYAGYEADKDRYGPPSGGGMPAWARLITGQSHWAGIAGAVEWNAMTSAQQKAAKPTQYAISKWCKTAKALIVAYWIMQHGDDWLESIGSTYADFAQGSASMLYGWIPFAPGGD